MAHVIGHFLRRLGGNRGERGVLAVRERLEIRMREGREQQLPDHGDGEIAVRLLDQQHVAVVAGIAQIGERVLVAALALDLAGIGVERARLADQVERHIGERQVFLQHRRMPAPFRQAMAEDQRVVGEPQRVGEDG